MYGMGLRECTTVEREKIAEIRPTLLKVCNNPSSLAGYNEHISRNTLGRFGQIFAILSLSTVAHFQIPILYIVQDGPLMRYTINAKNK